MGSGRRVLFAGGAVLVLEVVTGAFGAFLLGSSEVAAYVLGCIVLTAAATAVFAHSAAERRRDDDDGPDHGGGGPDDGGDEPPPWWPGFERDFRRYMRERERERSPV